MDCSDPADSPVIQWLYVTTFEDPIPTENASVITEAYLCGYHPTTTGPDDVEAQEFAWAQCSQVYLVIFAAAVIVVLLAHFGFFLAFLWDRVVNIARFSTAGTTSSPSQATWLPTRDGDDVILTFTPSYVWFANEGVGLSGGVEKVAGLTEEDFAYFERLANFVYDQSHGA